MSSIEPGRPEPNEYAPFFAGYMAKTESITNPAASLETQLNEFLTLLHAIPEERRTHRYAEGKWSVKEVLNHITDTERVFAYRLLRVARNDKTALPPFDENLFAANADADSVPWDDLVEEFTQVRRASINLLRNLPKPAWIRLGVASSHPISTRALAYLLYGHPAHHIAILKERYLA